MPRALARSAAVVALAASTVACGADAGLAPLARSDAAPAVIAERDGHYTAGPKDQGLDAAKHSYFATIETAKGEIELQLWPDLAPQNVNAFVFFAREGFYDGLTFHRVIADFVVQGGDPLGTGLGGPGFGLPAELHADDPVPMRAGAVAMARVTSRPDSAGSQFFVVTGDGQPVQNLTGLYTVIGWLTGKDGLAVARSIAQGDAMKSVTVRARDASASVVTADAVRAGAGDGDG